MKCIHCGRISNNYYAAPYCSEICRIKNLKITTKCSKCGKEFIPKTARQTVCSVDCIRAYSRKMTNQNNEMNTSRFKIFARDGFSCIYCGESSLDGNSLTVDHVFPIDKGGKNDVYNIATCCKRCNLEKHTFMLSEDQIMEIWNKNVNKKEYLSNKEDYDELKNIFDRKCKLKIA